MSTYVVRSLEQAKILTDPFKLKLLEQFAGEPVTTKQVADELGEKAPRLYRHVDAMVEAGFLELVRENPKRGTIERYYKTVASRFEIDPDLFGPGSADQDDAFEMIRDIFRDTESDLMTFAGLDPESTEALKELPMVMRVALRASKEDVARLRGKLEEWMAEVQALDDGGPGSEDDVRYAGLLAFYPLLDDPKQSP